MGKESVRTVKPSDLTNMSENDRTSTQKQQQTRSTKGQNAHKRLSKRTIFTDIHDQLWRGYMWIDGSLVISMLEDWETILLCMLKLKEKRRFKMYYLLTLFIPLQQSLW